jgi:hypothetical protein
MSQITLSSDTQSIRLIRDESTIALSQNLHSVTLNRLAGATVELTQTNSTLNLEQNENYITFIQRGLRGIPGAGGVQNLVIQQVAPTTTEPVYQWWETDGSGNLVTLWIETNGA